MSDDFRFLLGGGDDAQDVNGQIYVSEGKDETKYRARSVVVFTSASVFTALVTLAASWLMFAGHAPSWVVVPAISYFTINSPEKFVLAVGGVLTACFLILTAMSIRPFYAEADASIRRWGQLSWVTLVLTAIFLCASVCLPLDSNLLNDSPPPNWIKHMSVIELAHLVMASSFLFIFCLHAILTTWLYFEVNREWIKEEFAQLHSNEGIARIDKYEVYRQTGVPPLPPGSRYVKVVIIILTALSCAALGRPTRANVSIEWAAVGWGIIFLLTYTYDYFSIVKLIDPSGACQDPDTNTYI